MSRWQDTLISPDASVEEAIRAIGEGAMGVALVVDGGQRLLGIVTDGDVRRAIIRRVGLGQPVSRIMNPSPHTVQMGTTRDEVLALLHTHHLLQVPVVDVDFHVVGVETLQESGGHPRLDNWVFLMAGGFGSRLRPLTDACPKPMLQIAGKPVLESIVESFLSYGFHRFQIAVHYMADTIKDHFGDGAKWNATIRYVEEKTPLGTAGALGLFRSDNKLPVIVMNGDLLTRVNFVDLLRFHEREGVAATVCGRGYNQQVPYGVIDADEHLRVRRIIEKPIQEYFVNAGIYVLSPEVLAMLPSGEPLAMPDLLQSLIERKRKVCCFPIHEYWLDIGHMADFERATRDSYASTDERR